MQKQMGKGLYSSQYEHDACGVGMVVNIHGNKSHELVDNALRVLENMEHRGADDAECDGDKDFRQDAEFFHCRKG